MVDYRPINLCNVIYKIITRILVKRLIIYLKDHISLPQAPFMPSKWIVKNDLIAQETTLTMLKKIKGRGGVMTLNWI